MILQTIQNTACRNEERLESTDSIKVYSNIFLRHLVSRIQLPQHNQFVLSVYIRLGCKSSI